METKRPILNAYATNRAFRESNPEAAKQNATESAKRKAELKRMRLTPPQKPMKMTKNSINPFTLERTIMYERK